MQDRPAAACSLLQRKDNDMFLKYTTREGNFNFARPSEVSYSCHIAVCDDDANKIKTCNFEPTFDLNGSDVDEIDYELEESIGRYWSTSDDRKEMLEFLRANKAEIEAGNIRRRLAEIETEISALEEEKTRLTTTKKGQ